MRAHQLYSITLIMDLPKLRPALKFKGRLFKNANNYLSRLLAGRGYNELRFNECSLITSLTEFNNILINAICNKVGSITGKLSVEFRTCVM